jgi:hypothetical protein
LQMQETQAAIFSANKNGDDNAKYNSHHARCSAGSCISRVNGHSLRTPPHANKGLRWTDLHRRSLRSFPVILKETGEAIYLRATHTAIPAKMSTTCRKASHLPPDRLPTLTPSMAAEVFLSPEKKTATGLGSAWAPIGSKVRAGLHPRLLFRRSERFDRSADYSWQSIRYLRIDVAVERSFPTDVIS